MPLVKYVSIKYKDNAGKATIEAALARDVPLYLEEKNGWSVEEWKTKLGLT